MASANSRSEALTSVTNRRISEKQNTIKQIVEVYRGRINNTDK
jgi:hypothetical protein